MTKNYAKKKHVRSYADERGLKYTEAKAIIQPDSGEHIRAGIDDIVSEIVDHDKIDMAVRADKIGYANGSLNATILRSYIPLLDKLEDGWRLSNIGPGQNFFAVTSEDDEFVFTIMSGHKTAHASGTGDPFETFNVSEPLEETDEMSIVVENYDTNISDARFADFVASVLEEKFGALGATRFIDSQWALNIARNGRELDEWTAALAETMNAVFSAYQKMSNQ